MKRPPWNTAITLPSSVSPSEDIVKNYIGSDNYYLGGVKYSYSIYGSYPYFSYYYSAQLYVTYLRTVFLKPGTYTVLPYIYDEVVKAIVHTTIFYDYNHDQEGYNFRLYVDSDKNYQGEYAELGSLNRFAIKDFLKYGGTVEYYDEWASN